MEKVMLTVSALVMLSTIGLLKSEKNTGQFLPHQSQIIAEFNKFKEDHNKHYKSQVIHELRFQIFSKNHQKIRESNEEGNNYTLAINHLADLSIEEYRHLHNGFKIPREQSTTQSDRFPFNKVKEAFNEIRQKIPSNLSVLHIFPNSSLPISVDWRKNLPPIKEQGLCSSCWAFSTTAVLEGAYSILTGKVVSFSDQQLLDCDTKNAGCRGGLPTNSIDYVVKNGIELESEQPYIGKKRNFCKQGSNKSLFRPKGHHEFMVSDNNQLAAAVAQQPVSVAVDADSYVFQFYSHGVLDRNKCGIKISHAVAIVGYTPEAWIVRNSWGTSWGEDGHAYIKKDSGFGPGICGIALWNTIPYF